MVFKSFVRLIFTLTLIVIILGFGIAVILSYKLKQEYEKFTISLEDKDKDVIIINNGFFKVYFQKIENIYTSEYKLKDNPIKFKSNEYKFDEYDMQTTLSIMDHSDNPSEIIFHKDGKKRYFDSVYFLKMYKISNYEFTKKFNNSGYFVYVLKSFGDEYMLKKTNMSISKKRKYTVTDPQTSKILKKNDKAKQSPIKDDYVKKEKLRNNNFQFSDKISIDKKQLLKHESKRSKKSVDSQNSKLEKKISRKEKNKMVRGPTTI